MAEESSKPDSLINISIGPKLVYNRYSSGTPMIVGVLLFFLPFFSIKCNGVQLVSATGYHTAVGLEIKPEKDLDFMKGFGDRHSLDSDYEKARNSPSNKKGNSDTNKQEPNYFLMGIMVVGVISAIVSMTKFGKRLEISFWGAVACCALFVIVTFQVITFANRPEFSSGLIDLSISCTFYYWLSFLLFPLAAYIAYKQLIKNKLEEREEYIKQWMQESGYPNQSETTIPSNQDQ